VIFIDEFAPIGEQISIFSMSGSVCLGSILRHDEFSVEAFGADRISLGMFDYLDDALNVIPDRRDAKAGSNGGAAQAVRGPSEEPLGLERGALQKDKGQGKPPRATSAASDPTTPELTLFVNTHGALTKQFTLDGNGSLVKTEGGQIVAGTAMRVAIDDVQALADLINTRSSDQALTLGSMRGDLPAQVTVTTKKQLNGGVRPDIISRSRDYLVFGQGRRGFCLGDFDRKGITAEVQDRLDQSGGFVAALGTARSIIDRAVATPEHLCFEGPPLLGEGLAQDRQSRIPKAVDGDWLDTKCACPPLNTIEQALLKELQTKAAFALNAECARVRTAWLEQRTGEIASRCGLTREAARRIATRHADGVLLPAVELVFADPAIGTVTVGDVLANPDKYVDESLADPWEGPSYGRQTARVLQRPDGSLFINSFAHGGQTFELKLDAETIGKILQQTTAANVVRTMINHVLTGDLDEVEVDMLVRQAAAAANVGLRPVQQKLKQARIDHDKQQKAAARAMALMNRTDPRPQREAPFNNAPWLPEMEAYDTILNHAGGDIPPSRHIEDELNCARCNVVPGTHAFSSDGSDEPAAPQWNICKLDNCDAANLLEKHIDFIDAEEGYSVQCPPS
jgi:hypothetical protein